MSDEQTEQQRRGRRGRSRLRGARARLRRGAARRRRARRRSTRCATPRRTSWPRRSSTCSRARSSASARRSTTASTTTSSCRAPLTPDDLAGDRGADGARASPPTTRSSAASCRRTRAGPSSSSATSRSRSRSSTTCARAGEARRRRRCRRRRVYEHGPFVDLCKGPARRVAPARSARSSCSRVAGAYWRGDEKRPMLQRIYGTVWATQEELDQYLWRREEAKKRDHRRLGVAARPVQLPRRLARARPSGTRRARRSGARSRTRCASSRRGAATRRSSTPILVSKKLWEQSGHWDLYARQHVPGRVRGPDVQPQADELPGVDVHLPARSCARTATCRCASTSTAGSTATSARARCRGLTRVRQFIQDDAHIYVRPDQLARRDRGAARRGPRGVLLVRPRRRGSRSRRARTRRSATRRSGSGPRR